MTTSKIFIEGMYFELPSENAPTFVKGKLSINVEKFKQFLNDHQNKGGFVNIDLKVSNGGKAYGELNTWKPTDKQFKPDEPVESSLPDQIEYPDEEINPDEIPF